MQLRQSSVQCSAGSTGLVSHRCPLNAFSVLLFCLSAQSFQCSGAFTCWLILSFVVRMSAKHTFVIDIDCLFTKWNRNSFPDIGDLASIWLNWFCCSDSKLGCCCNYRICMGVRACVRACVRVCVASCALASKKTIEGSAAAYVAQLSAVLIIHRFGQLIC